MKYRKKLIICSLLAGLTILISNCHRQKPVLKILATKDLNFPSASAIEFYKNKLYVFGDDAAYLLTMTTSYQPLDSFFFAGTETGRMPKNKKHDIESAFVASQNGTSTLFGVGSFSTPGRMRVFAYNLHNSTISDTSFFEKQINFPSIVAVNLEGSCLVNETIVFANRANLSNPANHLIFFEQNSQQLRSVKLHLPKKEMVSGISGLYYLGEKDLLLFTASEEATASTVSDGAIGNSYIGWIENFSKKGKAAELYPDQYIKLSETNAVFQKQKIESICVEQVNGKNLTVHLAADNDNGTSKFFKLQIEL